MKKAIQFSALLLISLTFQNGLKAQPYILPVFPIDGEWMYQNVSSYPCAKIHVKLGKDTFISQRVGNFILPAREIKVRYLDAAENETGNSIFYTYRKDSNYVADTVYERILSWRYTVYDTANKYFQEFFPIRQPRAYPNSNFRVPLMYADPFDDRYRDLQMSINKELCWQFGQTRLKVFECQFSNRDKSVDAINGGPDFQFAERIGYLNGYFFKFDTTDFPNIPHGPLLWYRDSEIHYEPGVSDPDICYPTLLEDLRFVETFSIYPNPCIDFVTLINKGSGLAAYFITDTKGQSLTGYKGDFIGNTTIDMSHLPSGVYLLRILAENESAVLKLLKL